jgi:parallel beta-helix repeat protein
MQHGLASALAALVVTTLGLAQAATIIVPDDNPSLHDAVASAGPGDVVQVRSNSYAETIRVDAGQTGLVVESIGGIAVISPSHLEDAVTVKRVDGVTIRGFALQPSRGGVLLDSANGTTLENLDIGIGFRDGVRIKGGSNNTVKNVTVLLSKKSCFRIEKSPGAAVQDSSAVNCRRQGYLVKQSDGASLLNNVAGGNRGGGIRVIKSPNATLDANYCNGNGASGIRVQASPNLTITNNSALGCVRYGIRIQASPPIASTTDLTDAGNVGGGGKAALIVQ